MVELLRSGDCPTIKYTPATLSTLDEAADLFLNAAKSDATKKAYRSDWESFSLWAAEYGLCVLPADPRTVRRWITHLAHDLSRAPATISRSLTAISQAHKIVDLQTPTTAPEVVETYKGICRKVGTAQKRAKPLLLADLRTVIDAMRPTFLETRDAAMLLVGWAAALRRSELVALLLDDIDFVAEGMIVTIRSSKTDQEGAGYRIGIPFGRDDRHCPTKRLQKWIDLAEIKTGEPLFFSVGVDGQRFHKAVASRSPLSTRSVSDVLKRRIKKAGLTPRGYSGHSLRAGFVTTAAAAKIPEYMIQLHTRHRSAKSLRGYIREGKLFTENSLLTLL